MCCVTVSYGNCDYVRFMVHGSHLGLQLILVIFRYGFQQLFVTICFIYVQSHVFSNSMVEFLFSLLNLYYAVLHIDSLEFTRKTRLGLGNAKGPFMGLLYALNHGFNMTFYFCTNLSLC